MKRLIEIFWVFFKIGLFTIGGGYAMLPIIQKEIVETKKWMSNEEFLDAISLTNSLPGPLAINAAAFVGYRVKKAKGSVAAALGAATPSIIIILFVATIFNNITQYEIVQNIFNGIRPAVVALIFYSIIKLAKSAKIKENLNWLIALAAMVAIVFLNVHPIVIIILAALYGIFIRNSVINAGEVGKVDEQRSHLSTEAETDSIKKPESEPKA